MSKRAKILDSEFLSRGWERYGAHGCWAKNGVIYEPEGWADYNENGLEIRMELSNGSTKTPAKIRLAILEAFATATEDMA